MDGWVFSVAPHIAPLRKADTLYLDFWYAHIYPPWRRQQHIPPPLVVWTHEIDVVASVVFCNAPYGRSCGVGFALLLQKLEKGKPPWKDSLLSIQVTAHVSHFPW
jgi:hypothetical protein